MTSSLPAPAPPVTLETQPFWDATAEGRLVLPHCEECTTVIWYPRAFCPACGSTSVSWVDAAGTGSVYSCTVVRKGQGAYREAAPLDAGYRMRKTLYNLYHVLNHLNLFGASYLGQAQQMIDTLLAEAR